MIERDREKERERERDRKKERERLLKDSVKKNHMTHQEWPSVSITSKSMTYRDSVYLKN